MKFGTYTTVMGTAASLFGGTICYKMWFQGEFYRENLNLSGKTVLITGANQGIGCSVASEMASRGATVLMACRNAVSCEDSRRTIINRKHNHRISCLDLDLSNFVSVRKCAQNVKKSYPEGLDVLVLNAAVMTPTRKLTYVGIERMLAVNHLGHYLLVKELEPSLKKGSRVVSVTCADALKAEIDWEDFNSEKFSWQKAYGSSKLANILFVREFAIRMKDKGVTAVAVDPDFTLTGLTKDMPWRQFPSAIFTPISWIFQRHPLQASQPILFGAVDESVEENSGELFRNMKMVELPERLKDPELSKRMWDVSDIWSSQNRTPSN